MAYTTPNAKRDPTRWGKYWPNVTDLTQIATNQGAVNTDIVVDHSSSTGKHTAKNASAWMDSWVSTAFANINLTLNLNDQTKTDFLTLLTPVLDPNSWSPVSFTSPILVPSYNVGFYHNTSGGQYDWNNQSNGYWMGIANGKGVTASGKDAEWVLEVWANAYNDARVTHTAIRRTAAAGTTAYKPLTVGTPSMGVMMGASLGISTQFGSASKWAQNWLNTNGFPYCKNHYDQWYQNAEAILNALNARHTAFASNKLTWEEFYGGKFYPLQPLTFNYATTFTTITIGKHNGLPMFIIPGAFATATDGSHTAPPAAGSTATTGTISLLPAWDDTNMYLVLWVRPGLPGSGTSRIIPAASVGSLAIPAAASFSGSINAAPTITQGNAIFSDGSTGVLDILANNDTINGALMWTEHRKASGLHALGLDRLNGYSLVKNAVTVTVPGSIGSVNSMNLEAWPGTDPIYFGGLVMNAGGGIVAVTYGGDETNAMVYFRRVTAGTTNTGTFTCARVSRL